MKKGLFLFAVLVLSHATAFAYSNSSNSLLNIQTIGSSWGSESAVIQSRLVSSDRIVRITATNNLSGERDFTDEDQDATYTLESARGCILEAKVKTLHDGMRHLQSPRIVEISKATGNCK